MNTNRNFSFSRLGLVMKRDLMENWKFNLNVFLVVFLVYLAAYLFFMNTFVDGDHFDVSFYLTSHWAVFNAVRSFFLSWFAAEIMRNMRTKESRLSSLMLPASSLEKFVARALIVTLGGYLVIVLASLLAELAHWAFIPFFDDLPDKFKVWVWGNVWELVPSPVSHYIGNVVFGQAVLSVMFSLWGHSLFVLGGNFFRKSPFAKTVSVMVLLSLLLSCVAGLLDVGEVWNLLRPFMDFVQHSPDMSNVLGAFVFLCFTVFNWWFSYRLFAHRQVITPKFRVL